MKKSIILVSSTCKCAVFINLLSAEIAVIVHPSNANAVDEATISKIYLGREKSFADGYFRDSPCRSANPLPRVRHLMKRYLKKSSSQLEGLLVESWCLLGRALRPKKCSSDDEMVKLVAGNPSLMGYVRCGQGRC